MKCKLKLIAVSAAVAGTPALASSEPFFSLNNTHSVELLAFLLFVGVLLYLKVPSLLTGMLDQRANTIKSELDEARSLREQAQTILASYERKQKEVAEHAENVVAHAKAEAAAAAEQAKEDLRASIARRLQAAKDQIASAEASAVKEVRDTAVSVAIAAARDVITDAMTAKDASALVDDAIGEIGQKLH